MDLTGDPVYPCERCQTGHWQARRATLAEWRDGQFIIVPNFPVWVCDVCGAREYDADALELLQAALEPQAALRRSQRSPRSGASRRPPALRSPGRHSV